MIRIDKKNSVASESKIRKIGLYGPRSKFGLVRSDTWWRKNDLGAMFIVKSPASRKTLVSAFVALIVSELMISYGMADDGLSAPVPNVGQFEEYNTDSPDFDYAIYHYDGTIQTNQIDMAASAIKAIRRGGLSNKKRMTLIVFCNSTTASKSPTEVYPFGLYLESGAIRNSAIPIARLVAQPFIAHPMNWDHRISEWVYTTNNTSLNGPDVTQNMSYVRSTNTLDSGWFFELDDLTNKAQVYAKFGVARYFVTELGTYSEVYPVDDKIRNQTGTVRIWYDGNVVKKTSCYMENK